MFMEVYKKAFAVIMKKPLKLWALSLLSIVLSGVLVALCGFSIPILGLAVGVLFSTSMMMVYLRGYRGEEVNVIQLFECFKDRETIKRVLLGMGWMTMWIFLWGLIPIAGPIIALIRIYEYRLTPYILVFQPEVSITDAIKVSSEKTEGYKLQMWLADFLHVFIFGVVSFFLTLLALIPILGLIFGFISFVLSICYGVLAPLFSGLVQAAFYEEITAAKNTAAFAGPGNFANAGNAGNGPAAGGIFCPACGTKLNPNAGFCPACGRPLR